MQISSQTKLRYKAQIAMNNLQNTFSQNRNILLCKSCERVWRRLAVGWAISSTEGRRLKQRQALHMTTNRGQ